MATVVPVQDGKVVDTSASNQSLSATTEKSNSSLDKEAFLQLLVAQMKYQDPLEPTSNTEYISQLATFSSLEEMQNLNATMESSQATQLVGKQVIITVTSASGETSQVTGRVDYIARENGKTYVSVNNGLYSIDDVSYVVDDEYLDAENAATVFETLVSLLPDVNRVTIADKDDIYTAADYYNNLTNYQKQYINDYVDKSYLEKLQALVDEIAKLIGTDETDDNSKTDTETDTDTGNNTDGDTSVETD